MAGICRSALISVTAKSAVALPARGTALQMFFWLSWLVVMALIRLFAYLQMTFNGVFATHQHDLFSPGLGLFPAPGVVKPVLQRTVQWQLPTRAATSEEIRDSGLAEFAKQLANTRAVPQVPCYRVSEGVDISSLAFQVAIQQVLSAVD
jgi:hypothetical protein